MYRIFLFFGFYLLLLLPSFQLAAQSTAMRRPTAILFQINRSDNKIQALKEMKDEGSIDEIQEYDQAIGQSIIKAFRKEFNFCKVYFFNSNQLELVKAKRWKEVDFIDSSFTKFVYVPDSILNNIWIAENNYPPTPGYKIDEKSGHAVIEPTKNFVNTNDDMGIVLHDNNYQLLPGRLCYHRAGLRQIRIKKTIPKEYTYTYHGVKHFNKSLRNYFSE